jgi:hypothetical protein
LVPLVAAERGGLTPGELDGTTLDVPDEVANRTAFGRMGANRGLSAFPKLRFVALVECGTHVLFGAAEGPYSFSEIDLARQVLPRLTPGMLCIADCGFFGHTLWQRPPRPEPISSGASGPTPSCRTSKSWRTDPFSARSIPRRRIAGAASAARPCASSSTHA